MAFQSKERQLTPEHEGDRVIEHSGDTTWNSLYAAACHAGPDCVGQRLTVANASQLVRLIAIIAMGQVSQAAHIVSSLVPAAPAFSFAELRSEAIIRLTVQEEPHTPRIGYPRWQRDGFMFEAISWIAARQSHGPSVLMKDPHVSATSQGLDGLMLTLSQDKSAVETTTIFEDKCTDDPKSIFAGKVMTGFRERHDNRRSAEIIATASALLTRAGISDEFAARIAAAVTDRSRRRYRAAMTTVTELDNDAARASIFSPYGDLAGITSDQRHAACFVVPTELRPWFDQLGFQAVGYLNSLEDNLDV